MIRRSFAIRSVKREVSKIGVQLNLNKPLDVYDLRKIIFGKLISHEKRIPLIGYLHTKDEQTEIIETNYKVLETLELSFDKKVEITE